MGKCVSVGKTPTLFINKYFLLISITLALVFNLEFKKGKVVKAKYMQKI